MSIQIGILIALGLLLLVPILRYLAKFYKNRRILERIPAPPQYFFVGNLPILLHNPDQVFDKMRQLALDYYPIFRLSTFYVTLINFIEPNDVEIILSSTKHLTKSKVYTFLNQWLGTGLLTSTGAKWHNRRKILTPAFHFTILQQFVTIFNDETGKLVEKLQDECGKESTSIIPHITHFTLQSIGETAMGLTNVDEKTQTQYREAIYEMGRILFQRLAKPWMRIESIYNLTALGKKEKNTIKVLHDFSNFIITQREKDQTTDPIGAYSKKKRLAMLDLLLRAKREGADIDYEGIREEVDTFMFEGHDTTSMAISFILLALANHPDIQEKVAQEILEVLGKERLPTHTDLQELKYTERCIKESLRLFPSVPLISRYASEDFQTKTGYAIPEGTIIHIHIFDMHRNPNLYTDPLKFDPDRFLPENVQNRHPFAYIPFSAGPRNCIGQKFAFLELKAVLCGILRRFKLEKVDGMHDVKFRPDLVIRPVGDIRVKFSNRF